MIRRLTDEDYDEQAEVVQLDVRVGEGVAEGGVNDHEQDDAAHRPEGKFPPLEPLPQKPTTNLNRPSSR